MLKYSHVKQNILLCILYFGITWNFFNVLLNDLVELLIKTPYIFKPQSKPVKPLSKPLTSCKLYNYILCHTAMNCSSQNSNHLCYPCPGGSYSSKFPKHLNRNFKKWSSIIPSLFALNRIGSNSGESNSCVTQNNEHIYKSSSNGI